MLEDRFHPKITIGVMMAGRTYCTGDCLSAIIGLDYPKDKIQLLLLDRSNNEAFKAQYIRPFLEKHHAKYRQLKVIEKNQPHYDLATKLHLQFDVKEKKYQDIANNINLMARVTDGKYFLVVDDDTVIPPQTINQLLQDFNNDPKTAASQGISRAREAKYGLSSWDFGRYGRQNLAPMQRRQGSTPTGSGGTYCLLLDTGWIKRHPITLFYRTDNRLSGPDEALSNRIWQHGRHFYTNWEIKCYHITPLPNGLTVPLDIENNWEPAHYFIYRTFPLDSYATEEMFLEQQYYDE